MAKIHRTVLNELNQGVTQVSVTLHINLEALANVEAQLINVPDLEITHTSESGLTRRGIITQNSLESLENIEGLAIFNYSGIQS